MISKYIKTALITVPLICGSMFGKTYKGPNYTVNLNQDSFGIEINQENKNKATDMNLVGKEINSDNLIKIIKAYNSVEMLKRNEDGSLSTNNGYYMQKLSDKNGNNITILISSELDSLENEIIKADLNNNGKITQFETRNYQLLSEEERVKLEKEFYKAYNISSKEEFENYIQQIMDERAEYKKE
jgi:hypothetical protein